jgi:hypothetical protein
MKRRFRGFRDDRFALTTLQNPTWEVRTHAELIQAAQNERPIQQQAAQPPQTTPPPPVVPEIELATRASNETKVGRLLAAPKLATMSVDPAFELHNISHIAPEVAAQVAPKVEPELESPKPLAPNSVPSPVPSPAPNLAFGRAINKLAEFLARADTLEAISAATDQKIAQKTEESSENNPEDDNADEAEVEVEEYDDPALSPHERHSRKCIICHHPDRVGIEEHFLNWRNVDLIRQQYGLRDFRPIYRHARATGLMEQRRENLRFAADLIIEHADQVVPTAEGVLRAIRVSARLNDKGQWVNPPSHAEISYTNRPSTAQLGAVNHKVEEIPAPAATILSEETPQNLIGSPAIRNRRNPLKLNAPVPF